MGFINISYYSHKKKFTLHIENYPKNVILNDQFFYQKKIVLTIFYQKTSVVKIKQK